MGFSLKTPLDSLACPVSQGKQINNPWIPRTSSSQTRGRSIPEIARMDLQVSVWKSWNMLQLEVLFRSSLTPYAWKCMLLAYKSVFHSLKM